MQIEFHVQDGGKNAHQKKKVEKKTHGNEPRNDFNSILNRFQNFQLERQSLTYFYVFIISSLSRALNRNTERPMGSSKNIYKGLIMGR